jgi:predicted membrane-bound mannosyltransferase
MPHNENPGPDDWRLGIDPAERLEPAAAQITAQTTPHPDARSARRLDRPLIVITAEHLGWLIVVAYTLVSRFAALGWRPMFPREAARALGEYALATGRAYPPAAAHRLGWIGFAQIGIFHAFGVSDSSAQMAAAIGALLLAAAVFALRGAIGRAGALGLAAMLALSPTLTYFSRSGTTASAAIALVMVAVAYAAALSRRPTAARAVGLGIALVLAISAGPVGGIDALTGAVALVVTGLAAVLAGGNSVLRVRIWWTRYGWLLVAGGVAFLAGWIFLIEILSEAPFGFALAASMALLSRIGAPVRLDPVRFYAAIVSFYEFAIALAALTGIAAILTRQIKSFFAGWALVWMIASVGSWTLVPAYRPDFAVGIIVPLALVGACGIQWMHQLDAWDAIRYPAAALAVLTLYAMLLTNVVVAAPIASEAPWDRSASLLWSVPATTIETREQCNRAIKAAGRGATAALPADAQAIAWYLRSLAPSDDPKTATVIATRQAPNPTPTPDVSSNLQFGFEETWTPDFAKLALPTALRFFFTARAWSEVRVEEMLIALRKPTSAVASATPGAAPSPAASFTPAAGSSILPSAIAPSATPSPTAAPTVTAAPSPAPSPQ